MKESIFSFFNAPITNQVPNGVVCVSQLYAYITTSEWLRERTDQVRAASSDEKRFRRLKQSLLPYVTPAGIFSYQFGHHGHCLDHGDVIAGTGLVKHFCKARDLFFQVISGRARLRNGFIELAAQFFFRRFSPAVDFVYI